MATDATITRGLLDDELQQRLPAAPPLQAPAAKRKRRDVNELPAGAFAPPSAPADKKGMMKRALRELLDDHRGRDYEKEMRVAAERGLEEGAGGEVDRRRQQTFGLSRLPTMLQRARAAAAAELGGEGLDGADDDEVANGSTRWAVRVVAPGKRRWTRVLRGTPDELAVRDGARQVVEWPPATFAEGFTFTKSEFDACGVGDDDPRFGFEATLKIVELVNRFGGNFFIVHDRFGDESVTFEAVQQRYFAVVRAILKHRREQVEALGRHFSREETVAPLSSLFENHPAMQTAATWTDAEAVVSVPGSNAFVASAVARLGEPGSTERRFFDEEDTRCATTFRAALNTAIEKLVSADVDSHLRNARLQQLLAEFDAVAQRLAKETAATEAAMAEFQEMPARVRAVVDTHNETLMPRVYSRLEDCVVASLPPKKHVMAVREAGTALEKHLEDVLMSDADDAALEVIEIWQLLAQNAVLHRTVARRRRISADLAAVKQQLQQHQQ